MKPAPVARQELTDGRIVLVLKSGRRFNCLIVATNILEAPEYVVELVNKAKALQAFAEIMRDDILDIL